MTSKVCYETYTEGLESQGFQFQISKMYRTYIYETVHIAIHIDDSRFMILNSWFFVHDHYNDLWRFIYVQTDDQSRIPRHLRTSRTMSFEPVHSWIWARHHNHYWRRSFDWLKDAIIVIFLCYSHTVWLIPRCNLTIKPKRTPSLRPGRN